MFRIPHCGRAVLQRTAVVSKFYSSVVPTSSKYRWKDTLNYVGLRTYKVEKKKFVRYNLNPKVSTLYFNSFTNSVHNAVETIAPVMREKIEEMFSSDFETVERHFLQELRGGSVDLDVVFYVVKMMVVQNYLPQYLIKGVLNFSVENLNDVVHNHHQATELMILAFSCSAEVSHAFLLQMQNYLHKNIQEFNTGEIRYFYVCFEKCRFFVRHPLNDIVVDKLVEDMPDLVHSEIFNILRSLITSNYYNKQRVGKIAESLLKNNKILSIISDQSLHLYMRFFITRHYYDETLYNAFLSNYTFLVNTTKITNIKSSAMILTLFGSVQFQPNNSVYREICQKLEKICLEANYKPQYFSDNEWISQFIDGMTYFGIFSDDLLDKFFSSVNRVPDNHLKSMQYLYLHYTVLIEYPNYSGATILSHVIRDMDLGESERLIWEKKSDTGKNMAIIYDVLRNMLGKDYVHWYHILPHFMNSDIEIRLKENGSVVAFEPETYLERVGSNFEGDEPDVKRVVILYLGLNSILEGSPELKGRTAVKIRQLQKLGYHILTITKDELLEIPTQKGKIDFMTELIESNFDVKLA